MMERRTEDSVAAFRRGIRIEADGARRLRSASLAQAGRIEETRAFFRTVRREQPLLTSASVRANVPYQTPELMKRFLEGLRKAGLEDQAGYFTGFHSRARACASAICSGLSRPAMRSRLAMASWRSQPGVELAAARLNQRCARTRSRSTPRPCS